MKKVLLLSIFILSFCALLNAQLTTMHSFSGISPMGKFPPGSLVTDGTYLYGVTSWGGTYGVGTIFKILPNGTGFSTIYSFVQGTDGTYPDGSLYYDGTTLYGTTAGGGINNVGTVFKILPNGTGYALIHEFDVTNGSQPKGSLISDGTYLYGLTAAGGANGDGTIFKILPNGTGFVKMMDFNAASTGETPYGSLFYDGTALYGTAERGGTNGDGTVFKILPNGTGFVKLHDFNSSVNGALPHGSLISDGTYLYGTTVQGGSGGYGTVFKIMPNGTGFTTLVSFTGAPGSGDSPWGDLVSDGTYLYGLTVGGGGSDDGTLFRLMPNGTGFTILIQFTSLVNGRDPAGNLLYSGGTFYGTTLYGGSYDNGTIFRYNATVGVEEPSGTLLTSVFPNPSTGHFRITSPVDEGTITVLNTLGDIVCSSPFSGNLITLDLSGEPDGVYFIKVDPAQAPRNSVSLSGRIILSH